MAILSTKGNLAYGRYAFPPLIKTGDPCLPSVAGSSVLDGIDMFATPIGVTGKEPNAQWQTIALLR